MNEGVIAQIPENLVQVSWVGGHAAVAGSEVQLQTLSRELADLPDFRAELARPDPEIDTFWRGLMAARQLHDALDGFVDTCGIAVDDAGEPAIFVR